MINTKYVLIVDDEPINRMLLNLRLKYFETEQIKIDIYEANDGLESIEITKEMVDNNKKPSLIFMDWKMPRLSGVDAAEKIKEQYSHIPIVLHSAYLGIREISQNLKQFDDLLEKPIGEKLLENIVEKYLR